MSDAAKQAFICLILLQRIGLNMAKYVHSKDSKVYESVISEFEHFQALVKRYEKLLKAIAEL